MKNVYCAIDLGATSGRIIISADGTDLETVHRFPNQVYEQDGKWFWDTDYLFGEITKGLHLLTSRDDIRVKSIGIDTWGVDIVCLKDGKALAHPRAYRDPYTNGKPEEFFRLINQRQIYDTTGIQFLNFNTLFQMYACSSEQYEPFLKADTYLFMPDYFSYLLTGRKVCEYTILSTSQLLNPRTKEIDRKLVETAGGRIGCFPKVVFPGERVGLLKKEIAGFRYDVPVVAVAGHDTASAIAAVPRVADGKRIAYLSSGTWSLMGVVTDEPIINDDTYRLNFTNEGGIDGTTRLLKNITGMWILEQVRKEWQRAGKDYKYEELTEMAESAIAANENTLPQLNFDEQRFANPASMLGEIQQAAKEQGKEIQTDAETVATIFLSLAHRYGEVFRMLQSLLDWHIDLLYIIGGGARNSLLNRLTERAIGIPVVASHTEATAIGNILVQKRKTE